MNVNINTISKIIVLELFLLFLAKLLILGISLKLNSLALVDRQLGLQKYQYFDPYIRSLIVSKSAETSISLACCEINEMIGNCISLTSKPSFLSHQVARNIILTSSIAQACDSTLDTPDELYILADEKWIATQSKEDDSKHSHNKKVFASGFENIVTQSLGYLLRFMILLKLKELLLW